MQKTTPKRYKKLEFQTLKDTTSTPTILPYKNPCEISHFVIFSSRTIVRVITNMVLNTLDS